MTTSTTPVQTSKTARRILAAHFNAEWSRLVADPASSRQAAAWPVAAFAVDARGQADLDAVLAATGSAGGRPMEEADQLLAEVIRLARHDDLAARLVLQRVIAPLVLAAVRRTSDRPHLRRDLFADLASTAWLVIRTYPIERRPAKVAVNVVRDAEYLTCTRDARLLRATEVPEPATATLWHDRPTDEVGRPLGAGRHAADDVARLFAQARSAGVAEADLDLLDALVLAGRPVSEVARELRVSARTVYNRRMAVTSRLAALAAA
jgi:hypothetical protein